MTNLMLYSNTWNGKNAHKTYGETLEDIYLNLNAEKDFCEDFNPHEFIADKLGLELKTEDELDELSPNDWEEYMENLDDLFLKNVTDSDLYDICLYLSNRMNIAKGISSQIEDNDIYYFHEKIAEEDFFVTGSYSSDYIKIRDSDFDKEGKLNIPEVLYSYYEEIFEDTPEDIHKYLYLTSRDYTRDNEKILAFEPTYPFKDGEITDDMHIKCIYNNKSKDLGLLNTNNRHKWHLLAKDFMNEVDMIKEEELAATKEEGKETKAKKKEDLER